MELFTVYMFTPSSKTTTIKACAHGVRMRRAYACTWTYDDDISNHGQSQTAKFKFANILVSRFSDKIAKFFCRQYFGVYGILCFSLLADHRSHTRRGVTTLPPNTSPNILCSLRGFAISDHPTMCRDFVVFGIVCHAASTRQQTRRDAYSSMVAK